MRILLIANTLPPRDISGVGEQVLQLAAGLEEAGHQVRILGRGPDQARGPKVLFPLAVVPAFLRLWRSFRPHRIQVHESDGALVALLTAILAPLRLPHPKLVALLQVSYVEEWRAVRPLRDGDRILGRPSREEIAFKWLKAPLQILLGCLTAWLADGILAPSRRTATEIARDYGVETPRVVPNVTGGLERSAAARPERAWEDAMLFVGRLRIRKGVEVLLEALSRMPGEAGARLLIAGDGEHRQSLERHSEKLGLESRVRFLGRCGAGEVRALLSTARALVVPSTYEGMPLVVLEAMEACVPVIASAVSGIPEVVADGVTGWLVPPEDPAALAAVLDRVWQDAAEARRRGRAGRNRVAEEFSPAAAARAWEQAVTATPAAEEQNG